MKIEQFLDHVEHAYEQQNAPELARLHHPNARYAKFSGGFAVGRDAIEPYLPEIFAAAPKDIQSETVLREIEQVTPDLAIIDTRIKHIRVGDLEAVSVEGFTTVVVREDGEWLVAAIRGALVPKGVG